MISLKRKTSMAYCSKLHHGNSNEMKYALLQDTCELPSVSPRKCANVRVFDSLQTDRSKAGVRQCRIRCATIATNIPKTVTNYERMTFEQGVDPNSLPMNHSFYARSRRNGVVLPPISQAGNCFSKHTAQPSISTHTVGARTDAKQQALDQVRPEMLSRLPDGLIFLAQGDVKKKMRESCCQFVALPDMYKTARLNDHSSIPLLPDKNHRKEITINDVCFQNERLLYRSQAKERRIGICEATEPEQTKQNRRMTGVLMKKFDVIAFPEKIVTLNKFVQ